MYSGGSFGTMFEYTLHILEHSQNNEEVSEVMITEDIQADIDNDGQTIGNDDTKHSEKIFRHEVLHRFRSNPGRLIC